MKHTTTRALFAYWDRKRGRRAVPDRADIDPSDIRDILADTFILACSAGYPFRLAGTRVCTLFGRELKDGPFLDLWDGEARKTTFNLLVAAADENMGAVASVQAATEAGQTLDLELLLLPLRHRNPSSGRMLGALTPLERPYWLGARPLLPMTIGGWRHVGPSIDLNATPRFGVAAPAAEPPRTPHVRRLGSLVVYEGGRRD